MRLTIWNFLGMCLIVMWVSTWLLASITLGIASVIFSILLLIGWGLTAFTRESCVNCEHDAGDHDEKKGCSKCNCVINVVGDVEDDEDFALEILKERYAKGEISLGEFVAKTKNKEPEEDETPIQILKERYAKGEISKEEFENMKKELEK